MTNGQEKPSDWRARESRGPRERSLDTPMLVGVCVVFIYKCLEWKRTQQDKLRALYSKYPAKVCGVFFYRVTDLLLSTSQDTYLCLTRNTCLICKVYSIFSSINPMLLYAIIAFYASEFQNTKNHCIYSILQITTPHYAMFPYSSRVSFRSVFPLSYTLVSSLEHLIKDLRLDHSATHGLSNVALEALSVLAEVFCGFLIEGVRSVGLEKQELEHIHQLNHSSIHGRRGRLLCLPEDPRSQLVD